MWDGSDANKDGTGEVKKVDTTIEGSGIDTTLVLKPDMSFLTDPRQRTRSRSTPPSS